jgi:hypothetical protein
LNVPFEALCKPKIMMLKSMTLEKLENLSRERRQENLQKLKADQVPETTDQWQTINFKSKDFGQEFE